MDYIELQVSTTTEGVEIISNVLTNMNSKGILIEDPSDFEFQEKRSYDWDFMPEEVFNYSHEDVRVVGYFSREEDIDLIIEKLKVEFKRLKDMDLGLDLGTLEIFTKDIYQKDWENEWKKYFKVTKITDKVVIKPSWEEYKKKPEEKVINIDPGMAFGTGTHETTRMCIETLEKYIEKYKAKENKNPKVLDIGTGSGILAIVSALFGADAIGVDLDKLAVKIAKENVKLNSLENKIQIRYGDLTNVIKDFEKGDIVVANIIADIIILLSGNIRNFIKEGGVFISSGIINDRLEDVKESLLKNGFEIVETKNLGEWNLVVAK